MYDPPVSHEPSPPARGATAPTGTTPPAVDRRVAERRSLFPAPNAAANPQPRVARAPPRWESFEPPLLARYFTTLDFRLGPRQQEGLREFARRAAAVGAVPSLPAIRFAEA